MVAGLWAGDGLRPDQLPVGSGAGPLRNLSFRELESYFPIQSITVPGNALDTHAPGLPRTSMWVSEGCPEWNVVLDLKSIPASLVYIFILSPVWTRDSATFMKIKLFIL
ncbi:uncharacterized protein LOC144326139 isoform X2 [Podarcis muralis]